MRNILYLFILLSFTFISKGQTLSTDTFCLANRYSIGTIADSVHFGKPIIVDMNNDQKPDLVIYDFDNGKIKYYKNNGTTIVFDSEKSDNNVKSVAVGNLNGDLYPDIFTLEEGTGKVRVYENQLGAGGTFSHVTTVNPPIISTGTLVPKYVYVKDMDGDYVDDIVVTCIKKEVSGNDFYGYYIHKNDYYTTNNVFIPATSINIVNALIGVSSDPIITFGNFDNVGYNDGLLDIAYTSPSVVGGDVSVQSTSGVSLFYTVMTQSIINVSNGLNCQTLKTEDFNEDGVDDIGYMNSGINGGLKQIVFDNNLNYTVTPIISQPTGYDYALVDMNNDSKKEYLGFNTQNGRFFFNKNLGSNNPLMLSSYQYTLNTSANFNEAHFAVADIDGNGFQDIIATGAFGLNNHGAIRIIKNFSHSVKLSANNNAVSCSGSSVTISAGTDNIITNGNYTWSNSETTQTISTNLISDFEARYNFTLPNGGTCSLKSDAISITYTPGTLPTVSISASSSSLCSYESLTLTASVLGSINYNWSYTSFGSPYTFTEDTISLSVYQSAVIYTFTAENGGCFATQTISPVVKQTPYLPSPDGGYTICYGQSQIVNAYIGGSASFTSAYTYSWASDLTSSYPSTHTITVNPNTTTTYSVYAINDFCQSNTIAITVNVNALPTINANLTSTICNGATATVLYNNANNSYTTNTASGSISNLQYFAVTPSVTTIYTVTAEYNSCTVDSVFTIEVNAPPTNITISAPNSICVGETATLTANGATNYTWSTGATTNPIFISPTSTINYSVIGTNGVCTSSNSPTYSLVINPTPTITLLSISPSNTVCAGSTVTISANGANSYLLNGNIMNSSGEFTLIPTASTVFTITGTDANGCHTTSQTELVKTINVTPNPTLSIAGTTVLCSGQSTTLTANGANTYTWFAGSFTVSTSDQLIKSPLSSEIYTVIGSTNNCSAQSTATINVNPTPKITVASSSYSLCPVIDSATLTATSSNGNWNYTWQPIYLGTNSVTPSFTIGVNDVTATVTAKDIATGCNNTATITIYSKPVPLVTASPSSTTVCTNTSVSLIASGTAASYTWWPSLNVNSNYIFTATNPQTHTVIGTGTNGCKNFAVISVNIFNYQNVNAFATPSVICLGNTATLSVTGGTATVANYNGQEITPTKNEIYPITIQDINGCFYNDTAYVFINTDCVPKPFTGFSPNNDGKNDIFYIDGIAGVTNRVSIYDRWGIELYSQDNYNNTTIFWDGKYKGKVVPTGTYFYVIELKDTNEIKKGWLEITTN